MKPGPLDLEGTILELWRKPGVDFDLDGKKSSLAELLRIGGYFPLSRIQDRLPFGKSALTRWSKAIEGEIATCFIPICEEGNGRAMTTLVELNRLNDLMNAKVRKRQRSVEAADAQPK
jgi:hypothetical protein